MRSLLLALCASMLVVTGCKSADPNSVPDQIEVITQGKTTPEKLKAAERLAEIAKPDDAAAIAQAMKGAPPEVKSVLATVVGKLKNPAAIEGLAAAMDATAASGSDAMSAAVNGANKEIARAFMDIGTKGATKPLMALLEGTKDNYVRIEALTGLGKVKDPAAVPLLSKIATDERLEPFINKKALLSLAEINDPAALPAYLRMLFAERQGVSFYPEASYGVFLLGDAANDRILAVLKGEDKELLTWAKERKIIEAAIMAKAAQIESDLQDPRAVEPLIKLLKFEDPNPQYKLVVRMAAADSLGRMRTKAALKPLSEMLGEIESNARGSYVRALVQAGDTSVLPKLVACAKNGNWSARDNCMNGLAMLGGAKEAKEFDGFIKDESNRFVKECNEGIYGNVDCAKEKDALVGKRVTTMEKYKTVLTTVSGCADNKCVEGLLSNPETLIRERAGFELGRRDAKESLPALMAIVRKEVKDVPDLNPRFSAICAIDWITTAHPELKASLKADANALEGQVDAESKKVLTQRIVEEVKRIVVKLGRT